MRLLCEIGGTHIRVAICEGGVILSPRKYNVADFSALEGALWHYLADEKQKAVPCALAISCAAVDDGHGIFRFGNNPRWIIDPAALTAAGWTIERVVNDFSASAWGATQLDDKGVRTIRAGRHNEALPRAIFGPGTGLGLAYIFPLERGGYHVQLTHGGHMMSLVLTDEQFLIVELLRRIKGDGTTIVPENMCSGRGLPMLYKAVCEAYAYDKIHETPEDILNHAADPAVRETLRLFHEFFGLFAHLVTVTGSAYGGLYLDGGVLHHLQASKLFDAETFLNYMTLNPVPSVKTDLDHCPVHLVLDPYIALRGLQVMAEQTK
jgi:glucokinase